MNTPYARSFRSFSVSGSAVTLESGRLTPLCDVSTPPATTDARRSPPFTSATRNTRFPSAMRMRSPSLTSLASRGYGIETEPCVVGTSSDTTRTVSPGVSRMPSGSSTTLVRRRGPWMSCIRATVRPISALTARMRGTVCSSSSCVACEKLRRKTSTPAAMACRRCSSEASAGPSVATILVWRGNPFIRTDDSPRRFPSGTTYRDIRSFPGCACLRYAGWYDPHAGTTYRLRLYPRPRAIDGSYGWRQTFCFR